MFQNVHVKKRLFDSVAFNLVYTTLLPIVNWITTVSNVMYYCEFCKHLKAMFRNINKKAKTLQKEMEYFEQEDNNPCFGLSDYSSKKCNELLSILTIKDHSCRKTKISTILNYSSSTTDSSKHLRSKSKFKNILLPSRSKRLVSDLEETDHSIEVLDVKNGGNSKKQWNTFMTKFDHAMARKIQNLNEKFIKISLLVQEADDILSLQVLTILSITFVRTCSCIYLYISSDWKDCDPNAWISIGVQIFFDFLAFGSVAMEASLVTEEAQKFAVQIFRVRPVDQTKDLKSHLQSEMAAMTVYATDVQLTAWKFFTVSRNFVPTVIGVTVTYILLIVQLYQVIQDSKCIKKLSN
ncbi:hypothetical protein JTE90_022113 [Oedothorax gibbosus]|uniref:Gustatory receptor n=1 Tax=Oedothorax gibbosus TaxID=931172 RepID=A0AAV6VT13_9ARAC|nr:hypothetical protein JTE90_022113 [Oedothorax gibbosus]